MAQIGVFGSGKALLFFDLLNFECELIFGIPVLLKPFRQNSCPIEYSDKPEEQADISECCLATG